LGLLRRGLLSLFLGPALLLSQRAGGRAWALANRKRSTAFRLPPRRRRWRSALARWRRAVLPLRLRLPLRWVLARQFLAAPDFLLGQVVHELLDGVGPHSFADRVQQDVGGIELCPVVHAVGFISMLNTTVCADGAIRDVGVNLHVQGGGRVGSGLGRHGCGLVLCWRVILDLRYCQMLWCLEVENVSARDTISRDGRP
jgi:hypothetical protein